MTALTTLEKVRLVDALCRTRFVSFAYKVFNTLMPNRRLEMNFHIEAMAFELEQVRLGKNKRLIFNIPPRCLKCIVTSVAFVAYILGHNPGKRVIVVSYNSDLAKTLHNYCRLIMKSPWYRRIFPLTRIVKDTETEFVTTQNGGRLATSVEGTLTGVGGDIVIIDDPLSSIDARSDRNIQRVNDWYNANFPMRLDDKQEGAIIVVMQRLDDLDLTGTLLRSSSENYKRLKIAAIAEKDERVQIGPNKFYCRRVGDVLHPEREPLPYLEAIRSRSPEMFAAQFQQAPFPRGGGIIPRKWVCYYDQLPARTSSSLVIQSWDTASGIGVSNDWSACTTWLLHDHKYYLMHVLRERLDYPSLKARAIAHAHEYKPNKILIEDTGVGKGLVPELKTAGLTAVAVKPEGNKKTRMSIQSAKFEARLVFFPKQAPWLADYEAELFNFPNVLFDDQVDSTSQALACPHSTFSMLALADGMEGLISGLAFQKLFTGQ